MAVLDVRISDEADRALGEVALPAPHCAVGPSGPARPARDDRALAGDNGSRVSELNEQKSSPQPVLPESMAFLEIPRSHFDEYSFSYRGFRV